MSALIGNPLLLPGEGYQISRSVRFRRSASAYFSRSTSASNRKTWTWSGWVKRADLSNWQALFMQGVSGTTEGKIQFEDAGTGLRMRWEDYVSGTYNLALYTTQVFRDPSAWYHIVAALDTTQATASNRAKLYVNGVQVTAFNTATYPSQNYDGVVNNGQTFNIGNGGGNYLDGYMADVYFIDGQALTPSAFGETDAITGVWKPKKYGGTYGTNGFYLNFSDNSAATAAAIGKDYSGNGNNWTPNNISLTSGATYDSMLDVPTPWADRGNYAVLNPLVPVAASTLTNGNLTTSRTGTAGGHNRVSTMDVSSGRWYWEVVCTSVASNGVIGIFTESQVGSGADPAYAYVTNGQKSVGGSLSAYGASLASGDVVGVALDLSAGEITFYKNGTSQGVAATGVSGTFFPGVRHANAAGTGTYDFNFGQRPFAYSVPTGFKALHTGNLPEPTIKKGNQYFDATVWAGNSSTQNIVNAGAFQPDLVWVKDRSTVNIENHWLADSVRGATKHLSSNLTDAEYTFTTDITGFNSNGFALGADGKVNRSGDTYVGWQWKKGATPGLDIVTYTGTGTAAQNVSHSLGVAPKMMIVKQRSAGANSWNVYVEAGGNTKALQLNGTGAYDTSANYWNNTSPTSSVFTVSTNVGVGGYNNASGATYVAYLFSEVAGFSKFGSFTGNGSADGPFVYCGFRPRYVLIKRADSTGDWNVYDTQRDLYNVASQYLAPNTSAGEGTFANADILSNGFKWRTSLVNGSTYIFAAFAETPQKFSLAR